MASIYWYVNSCSGDKVSGNTQIDRCGCKENYSNDCTPTGYRRTCEKDSNGCYTGYGTQDYTSTSECFDCSQKEEERAYIPSLCYSDKTPNWQYISGAYQCTKVSDYSPGNAMVCSGKQQQQDKNLCSDTGGDYRWVDNSAACVKADAKSTTYTCSQLGLSGTGSVTLSIGSSDFCGRDKSTANAIRDNWISTNGTNWAKEHISCTPVSTTGTLVIHLRSNQGYVNLCNKDNPTLYFNSDSTLNSKVLHGIMGTTIRVSNLKVDMYRMSFESSTGKIWFDTRTSSQACTNPPISISDSCHMLEGNVINDISKFTIRGGEETNVYITFTC